MLTPQEVAERAFTKATFGGYNMGDVDNFLDVLMTDYETLYNDNALLKQKLGKLSATIREYQSTEESMRKTLLAAQRMADEMVQSAQASRDEAIKEAERNALALTAELRREVEHEQARLLAARNTADDFIARIRKLCEEQITYIDNLGTLIPDIPKQPDKLEAAVRDIEASIRRSIEQAAVTVPADEPAEECGGEYDDFAMPGDGDMGSLSDPADSAAPGDEYSGRSDVPISRSRADKFSDLDKNFGGEYEIK